MADSDFLSEEEYKKFVDKKDDKWYEKLGITEEEIRVLVHEMLEGMYFLINTVIEFAENDERIESEKIGYYRKYLKCVGDALIELEK